MASAYGSIAYAQTLAHIGSPVWLPSARGALLSRPIPGHAHRDLVGPYPWSDFEEWDRLGEDLEKLESSEDAPVSVVAVISPTARASDRVLREAFPHHLVKFKKHHLVDLTSDFAASFRSSHRRKMRQIDQSIVITVEPDSEAVASDWVALYGHLATRHKIGGAADFPESSLRSQVALPGVVVCSARLDGQVIGAITFVQNGDDAAYHLGAFSPLGYEHEVAFALFPLAFEFLRSRGVLVVNLGGGAGTSVESDDGLVQFKRGWATHAAYARIGGRVIITDVYNELAAGESSEFFPAYRTGIVR